MPTIMTIQELHQRFDGPVPRDLLRLAQQAPERVARAAQTRLTVRWHDQTVIEHMAEIIVEIHETDDGTVTEHDLICRGFTRQQVTAHRSAALHLARPRLKDRAA